MRPVELNVIEGGIQRLREKGGASPKSLFDLKNGYVTADKAIKSRPGTFRHASLPAGTKGLTAFEGELHVFAHTSIGGIPSGYVLHILQHPAITDAAGDPIEIKRIHFAEPFMGSLYVVAEFDVAIAGSITENVYHFWLQGDADENAWQASTEYGAGDLVSPTTPDGTFFQAGRLGQPNPSWTADTPRAEGDLIEPTVYNDFYYEVVQALGDDPRSGTVEPDWPTTTGEQVVEDVRGEDLQGSAQPPPVPISPEQRERYLRELISGAF